MNPRIRSIFFFLTPVILVVGLSYYLQIAIINNQKEFAIWLSQFGPYLLLVYVFLQALTIIIAPLGGFFLTVALIALFGPGFALILAYCVTTPCYMINFTLARRYGRPLAERIIGKQTLDQIDHFVQDAGVSTLIILKLLMGGSFDYLSYGLGLTKMPFGIFAIVNVVVGVPGMVIMWLVFKQIDSLSFAVIAFYLTSTLFALISIYLNHRLRRHRLPQADDEVAS